MPSKPKHAKAPGNKGGRVYFIDASGGRLLSVNPDGSDVKELVTGRHRSDIEVLFDLLPEPIDLDLDLESRFLYWTDRGDLPRGNTVSRAPIDAAPQSVEPEIVFTHLMEGIGLALDVS
jgi:hypothetical protein